MRSEYTNLSFMSSPIAGFKNRVVNEQQDYEIASLEEFWRSLLFKSKKIGRRIISDIFDGEEKGLKLDSFYFRFVSWNCSNLRVVAVFVRDFVLSSQIWRTKR